MAATAYYFGCVKGAGHFFCVGDELTLTPRKLVPSFPEPWERLMDGGLLVNGRVPDCPDGLVYWTAAKDLWLAFYWWDRSVDTRPGSNSAFYVHGYSHARAGAAFLFATDKCRAVVDRQRFQLALVVTQAS